MLPARLRQMGAALGREAQKRRQDDGVHAPSSASWPFSAFAAATITRDDPIGTGLAAMRVGWAAFILPFVFVATPAILMQAA